MAVATGRWRFALVAAVMLVLAPVVLALGRMPGADPVRGENGLAGFHQRANVDQESYGEDELVRLTYEACRTRPWPTQTSSGHVPVIAEFRVVNEAGDVVADTSHRVYPAVRRFVWWLPGQCRSVDSEWDQHYWNQEEWDPERHGREVGNPVRGERVEPGAYRLEVWWVTAPRGDSPEDHEQVDTSWFEVRP